MAKETNRHKSKSEQNKIKSKTSSSLKKILILGVLILLIFTAVVLLEPGTKVEAGLPSTVNVDKAFELRQAGIFVLDVREDHEWKTVHIPGATLIPLGELENRLNEIPDDEDILVVCRSGNRSATARDILLNSGFNNVTSMAGGMIDWVNRSYEVVSGENK